jgi:hypothetical protein
MQIAVHVLAYNVSRFIKPVLANMAPFVHKILSNVQGAHDTCSIYMTYLWDFMSFT